MKLNQLDKMIFLQSGTFDNPVWTVEQVVAVYLFGFIIAAFLVYTAFTGLYEGFKELINKFKK